MTVYSELDSETKAYPRRMGEVIEICARSLSMGLEDSLDRIVSVRNKEFVKHLRRNGIDGHEINKMLNNWHGLKTAIHIPLTERDKAELKNIDYVMRHLETLIRNVAIRDEEKDYLRGIKTRIGEMYYLPDEKRKSGTPFTMFKMGKGNAKTYKQMIGLRMAGIYKYVKKFNRNSHIYLINDIYDLIAELFETCLDKKYTRENIKNFVTNNF